MFFSLMAQREKREMRELVCFGFIVTSSYRRTWPCTSHNVFPAALLHVKAITECFVLRHQLFLDQVLWLCTEIPSIAKLIIK